MIRPICLAIISCSLFVMPARAQESLNHFTAEVGAGFSFPIGIYADHLKTGFNFVASGGPRFNSHFTLTADFSLHYLNVKHAEQISGNTPQISLGSMMRMWSLTLNPGFELIKQERFSFYATAGYGLYNRRLLLAAPGPIPIEGCDEFWDVCVSHSGPLSNEIVTGNLSVYKAGYNAGGGVTFGAHTKFFIESRYHHMFTPRTLQIIPITFGVRW